MELLNSLNNQQKEAVSHAEGPSMVLAGAGSGKTRVLIYKIAYLIQLGADPFTILALTFTNKAAREMKDRIIGILGSSDARNVWMGTFHAVFARILRREGHLLGYPSNFTIYDTTDSKNLIKSITKEFSLDPKEYHPSYVYSRISAAKTNLITAEDYLKNSDILAHDRQAKKPEIGRIYEAYWNRCRKASAMDFDDILYNTHVLFNHHPVALSQYQRLFKYVLVDEYQDTNHVQYQIIKKLAANNENITVVGDDAQSIYGFRGANIQNILNFKSDYPDAQIFKLEQNYRSTKSIVNAANSVINKNKQQFHKEIWTENDEGKKLKLIKASTDNEEGTLVCNSIFEVSMNQKLAYDSFTILYRTNAQSRVFEEGLRRLNIPYRIFGGQSFYNRKEIKDLLAYFRLTINNKDEEALKRIINYPARGIGKTTLEKITVLASENKLSIWEIISDQKLTQMHFNSGIQRRISEFSTMILSFGAELEKTNAFDLAKKISKSSGILKTLHEDDTPEGISRYENIEELLNGIKEFTEGDFTTELIEEVFDEHIESEDKKEKSEDKKLKKLDEYMQDIALLTDAENKENDDIPKVSLMTIHAAKGLEFPVVFIVGLEENLFPSIQSLNTRTELEEERRLFYVALTRAEQQAFISFAETRYRWGNLIFTEPSRFIKEIDDQYIEKPQRVKMNKPIVRQEKKEHRWGNKNTGAKKAVKPAAPTKSPVPKNLRKLSDVDTVRNPPAQSLNFKEGMTVDHPRFGKGEIKKLEGAGASAKALIDFKSAGEKQLLLKFAKLTIISES